MTHTRSLLPVGTHIQLESGSTYRITGDAIGYGGGSIIYPVERMIRKDQALVPDGFSYALKECYPASMNVSFSRSPDGTIVPDTDNEANRAFLCRAQQLQLQEGTTSQIIYRTASRMLPIREYAEKVTVELPDQKSVPVTNTVTIMESLSQKGCSLHSLLQEKRRIAPAEAFRIIQQLLFALQEVHQAGFLHLDIQDGNVFLRGALQNNSEFLTLIDFGSARPIENGQTAPIADRVIFTTEGFSAPEMIQCNDGTLRLGVEADLYSVGCLALYMLTGHRPSSRALLYNRSGSYLTASQIARMKCPNHLTDRLQKILSHALEIDPQNRYHSAEEMLNDVTELIQALQPYRTDLSAVSYDAFVCYKHGPVDSAAAITLQRALENFRAPRDIRRGRKPFRRVFVDEGELSSCADFGQQIREALKNSGWLIVICSPDTPTSPWVQLEIETFLEYHDRSRILAVLTAGEPDTSYPAQLKSNQAGYGEVLAADARGKDLKEVIHLLKKNALLKVAAPMLGTTYDGLKQRQKIYQMQRIAAAASVLLLGAVGFSAYAVNRANVIAAQAEQIAQQADKIEEEYQNSLLNESRFLAEQAQKRLDDNDPLGAIELALEALPSEKRLRPVIPEAEYVLGKALGIYTTPSTAKNEPAIIGIIPASSSNYFIDDRGENLIHWKPYYHGIQVWDADTLKIKLTILSEYRITGVVGIAASTNSIVAYSDNTIICADYITGKIQWIKNVPALYSASVSQNQGAVIAFSSSDQNDSRDRSQWHPIEISVQVLLLNSGKEVRSFSFQIDDVAFLEKIYVSSDLAWAAVIAKYQHSSFFDASDIHDTLYLLNIEENDCQELFRTDSSVDCVLFYNDRLAVTRINGYHSFIKDKDGSTLTLSPCTVDMEVYDLSSAKCVWSQQASGSLKGGIVDIHFFPSEKGSDMGNRIIFTFSDKCVLLAEKDGKILQSFDMQAPIYDISYNEDQIEVVNGNGMISTAFFKSGIIRSKITLGNNISAVHRFDNSFFIQSNPGHFGGNYQIRKYELDKPSDQYRLITGIPEITTKSLWDLKWCGVLPDGIKVLFQNGNEFMLVDELTGRTKAVPFPQKTDSWNCRILGISSDKTQLFFCAPSDSDSNLFLSCNVYAMDLCNGFITELTNQPNCLFLHDSIEKTYWNDGVVVCGEDYATHQKGVFYWKFRDDQLINLLDIDSAFGSIDSFGSKYAFYFQGDYFDSENERFQFVLTNEQDNPSKLVSFDMKSLTYKAIDINFSLPEKRTWGQGSNWDVKGYQWDTAQKYVSFCYQDTLYLLNSQGMCLWTKDISELRTVLEQVVFDSDNELLLMFFNNGLIQGYSLLDGSLNACIEMKDYCIDLNYKCQSRVGHQVKKRSSNSRKDMKQQAGKRTGKRSPLDMETVIDPVEEGFNRLPFFADSSGVSIS